MKVSASLEIRGPSLRTMTELSRGWVKVSKHGVVESQIPLLAPPCSARRPWANVVALAPQFPHLISGDKQAYLHCSGSQPEVILSPSRDAWEMSGDIFGCHSCHSRGQECSSISYNVQGSLHHRG